jgi:ketose-bisphosphate aldolase
MGLVTFQDLLARAQHKGYALGYCESWDVYSLEAALEAAEEMDSPVILGFGGAVAYQPWLDKHGVEELSTLARCLAERASVPAAVLFNEARTYGQVLRGLRCGCNAVMQDTSHLPLEENRALTQRVVEAAHPLGAAVEAELGHLADATDASVKAIGTDPAEAAQFVASTGVDALAVSIGNVHILAQGEAAVDLELLECIHAAVSVPLVIHGGTGFPPAAVRGSIERGVAKFNVGTRLKQAFLDGVRDAASSLPGRPNVHSVVGSREEADVFNAGKARVKAQIKSLIQLYGSAGQAKGW